MYLSSLWLLQTSCITSDNSLLACCLNSIFLDVFILIKILKARTKFQPLQSFLPLLRLQVLLFHDSHVTPAPFYLLSRTGFYSTASGTRTHTAAMAKGFSYSIVKMLLGLCYNHMLSTQVAGIQSLHIYRYFYLTQLGVIIIYKADTFTELACFYIRSFPLCTHYPIPTSKIISL